MADTTALRNKILQLAIEGKLVEQRAEEGDARELLDEIKAEKAQLIAEKKIKKDKPLAPISDTDKPFNIPDSWVWVRWGTLSESIQYGYNAPAKGKGRIKMVRISDIQNGEIAWETTPYCDIEEQDIDAYKLKKNDILFARTGGTVGKSYLVSKEPQDAIYAGYLIRTRYSGQLCPQYLKLFMECSLYWEQLKDGTTATAQPNCNGQKLAKMILPLPPLGEQKRIVEKLDEVMKALDEIEQGRKNIEALKDKLRNKALQTAIEGKLVEQRAEEGDARALLDEIKAEKAQLIAEKKIKKDKPLAPIDDSEIPFDIPDSWVWVRLGEVCEYNPKSQLDDELEVGFVPMTLVKEGYNDYNSYEIKKWKDVKTGYTHFANGDLVVAKITPCFQNKKSAIIRDLPNNVGAGTTEFHVLRNKRIYLMKFLLYICKTDEFIAGGVRQFSGTSGQQRVSADYIKNLPIPLPPLGEQKRIVEKLDEVMAEIDKL